MGSLLSSHWYVVGRRVKFFVTIHHEESTIYKREKHSLFYPYCKIPYIVVLCFQDCR